MDIDFHYYGTMYAALLAGYDQKDAIEIAEAAQFVDEFTPHQFPKGIEGVGGKEPVNCYYTSFDFDTTGMIDQATSWDSTLAKKWMPFHFTPRMDSGDKITIGEVEYQSTIKDPKHLKMITAPTGKIFNLIRTVATKDNVEIGLKMHVLADMFAHQGFVGYRFKDINCIANEVEIIDGTESVMKKITGNMFHFVAIGHADCGHYPDYGYAVYKYKPSWNGKTEYVLRDNPKIFYSTFFHMFNTLVDIKCTNDGSALDEMHKRAAAIKENAGKKLLEVQEMLKQKGVNEFQTNLWYQKICEDFKISHLIKIYSVDEANKPINSTVCHIYKKNHDDSIDKSNTKLARFETAARKHYNMVKGYVDFKKI